MSNIEPLIEEELLTNAKATSLRFKGASFFNPGTLTMVLGCGGIGSHVAYLLDAQECHLIVYDMDILEEHNIGTQLFQDSSYINSAKVHALRDFLTLSRRLDEDLRSFHDSNIFKNEAYDENSLICNYTFSCFDNMAARKLAFEKWCEIESTDKIFIDGRMLADQGMIYVVTPGKEEKYRETLFDDSEVEEGPCSNRATAFCAFFISSLMVNIFNNYISNIKEGDNLREVPFGVRFILPLMMITEIP